MFTDARTWIFGGLALASLAGLRGAFNVRESLTLVPVLVKKFAAPDRRGCTPQGCDGAPLFVDQNRIAHPNAFK